MSEAAKFVIKVGEKEIELNEEILAILHKYVRTDMTLEDLTRHLGLRSWEEAYEFIKKVPAWILWIPPTLWKTLKEMKSVQEEYVK
ncbi:MAG: hypothetical protein GSR72_01255 [Desulfurococcales archaeon]|nr:hypothetical protein [Desulfurococcales archaeon]MEB3759571.1 hypothetical protein [Desulfurococcales archaeon]MEB3764915.1 hypothetical protein [Desulfurococcales archaeon]MEB3788504.1 hypothetical protein [Desulfurococcales archaeon]